MLLPKSVTSKPPIPMALVEDVIRDIFLRLPPGGDLVRVAAVCRSWRAMLSEAAFTRDYLRLHGEPPMLGFLYVDGHTHEDGEHHWVSHFVSAGPFDSPAFQDRLHWRVLDSRHGLVLFFTPMLDVDFVVCDLVTGDQWGIRASPECEDIMSWEYYDGHLYPRESQYTGIHCSAVVLCANDRCNHHLFCHGGHFRVALVGSVQDDPEAHATVYSSETGEWSSMITGPNPDFIDGRGHSAVVGNKVYVSCFEIDSVVVEYDMVEQQLSVIDCPLEDQDKYQPYIRLMGVDDGMLLFASVLNPRLYLWSMEAGPSGTAGWARRVVDLEPFLPANVLTQTSDVLPVGFAEGVSVIFLTTKDGLYTIDLNLGEGQKVRERWTEKVMPYMSFYTEA